MVALSEDFSPRLLINELLSDDDWFVKHVGQFIAVVETGEVYASQSDEQLAWLLSIMHPDKHITFFDVNAASRKRLCI